MHIRRYEDYCPIRAFQTASLPTAGGSTRTAKVTAAALKTNTTAHGFGPEFKCLLGNRPYLLLRLGFEEGESERRLSSSLSLLFTVPSYDLLSESLTPSILQYLHFCCRGPIPTVVPASFLSTRLLPKKESK